VSVSRGLGQAERHAVLKSMEISIHSFFKKKTG
jgi:hypothetical protein